MLKASADQVSILAQTGEGFMKSYTYGDIWGAKGYLLMVLEEKRGGFIQERVPSETTLAQPYTLAHKCNTQ